MAASFNSAKQATVYSLNFFCKFYVKILKGFIFFQVVDHIPDITSIQKDRRYEEVK